ncbi:hypothetical protein LJC23_06205, partial [Desulfovibrio sp. OttesenSCG-928-I05]|nr:hypothetical protein [Desulfovibrio sp. OttesenSCG-928-I05]
SDNLKAKLLYGQKATARPLPLSRPLRCVRRIRIENSAFIHYVDKTSATAHQVMKKSMILQIKATRKATYIQIHRAHGHNSIPEYKRLVIFWKEYRHKSCLWMFCLVP